MTVLSAYAKFNDIADTIEPMKDPEKWALYKGLAELAQGIAQELQQIQNDVRRLERR